MDELGLMIVLGWLFCLTFGAVADLLIELKAERGWAVAPNATDPLLSGGNRSRLDTVFTRATTPRATIETVATLATPSTNMVRKSFILHLVAHTTELKELATRNCCQVLFLPMLFLIEVDVFFISTSTKTKTRTYYICGAPNFMNALEILKIAHRIKMPTTLVIANYILAFCCKNETLKA